MNFVNIFCYWKFVLQPSAIKTDDKTKCASRSKLTKCTSSRGRILL